MYYFYNQFLETILTAERWATAEDLLQRPHSFLSSPSLDIGKEVLTRLKTAFGKDAVKYIVLLKEDRAKKPNKWPANLPTSKGDPKGMVAFHGAIITHLLQHERGTVQLRESSSLFPMPNGGGASAPVIVEDVKIFDQVMENVTVEVVPTVTDLPQKKVLNFQELHQQFEEKKRLSTVEEDGRTVMLKSSHSFQGYQLTKDIREASHIMDKVFQDMEDILVNYGQVLRDLDAQIEDELHFVEFADVDASRCVKSYKRLQELRVKRRCVKDSMQLADLLVKNLGTDLAKRLNHVSDKINHLDERMYTLRVPEEFKH